MAALPEQLPVLFRGVLGEPINLQALGGFLSWRVLNFVPVLLGVWSILTLSSTLAGEARRGSLDIVASTPLSRDSIAIQKGAAHLVAMAVACAILGLFTWVATLVSATLPGDEVPAGAVAAHMVWLVLVAVAPGLLAWVVAPIVGRGAAAALGALGLISSFVVHGYSEAITAFEALDAVSYFGLTAGHRPMAGVSDWPSLGVLFAVEGVLFVLGVLVFRTRDIGITRDVALPLPRLRLGLGGVIGRSFAERLPVAAWFGLGLGLMGLVYAINSAAFTESLRSIPQIQRIVQQFMPGVDIFTPGGVLQLVFFGFGTLLVAGAAGLLASGWASDESEGRLEVILAAPVSRTAWGVRSGVGALGAVAVLGVAMAALVAVGVIGAGGDPLDPVLGALVLGGYTAALLGVGLAAGGLVRPSLAGPVAAGLGLAFYLIDVLGAALQLPDELLQLSLTRHLGQPMAGVFDASGIVACAVLALGGVAVAAVGLRRRDIER
jgi:ABC-2 type transport system permease protein